MSVELERFKATLADLKSQRDNIAPQLERLQEKLDRLDRAIEPLEEIVAAEKQAVRSNGSTGAYAGMTILGACLKYLEDVGRRRTAKQVANAIFSGGIVTTSKKPNILIYNLLDRARQKNKALKRIKGGQWVYRKS